MIWYITRALIYKGITWYLYLDGWSELARKFIQTLHMEPAQLAKQTVAMTHQTTTAKRLSGAMLSLKDMTSTE